MRATQTVTVPGTLAGIRDAMDAFARFGATHDVPAGAAWRFQLALDEILSNIVRHGGLDAETGIELTFAASGEDVSVEIVDGAAPFNPLLAPQADTAAPLERRQPGGIGISLVRGLMHDARYERRDGHNHFFVTWRTHAYR